MERLRLDLRVLAETLVVCQFPAGTDIPTHARNSGLWACIVTEDEITLVGPEAIIPPQPSKVEREWRALQVVGPLDFSLVGVLAQLSAVLAEAGISIFVLSTYNTDYLLVKSAHLVDALQALKQAGHTIFDHPTDCR